MLVLRKGKDLKRDSLWAIGWLSLFVGGLSIGAALYLALTPTVLKTPKPDQVSEQPTVKPVARLLLQSRKMGLSDRESVKALLELLNVQIAPDVAWSKLLKPDQIGDGIVALHSLDGHYWLQLPQPDGSSTWLESDGNAPRPDFLFPNHDEPHLLSGHLPRAFWQSLLPEAERDSCLLWPQLLTQLPDEATLLVDSDPLTLRLSWAWPNQPNASKQLPAHDPSGTDAIYSAALNEASEHCDDNPYILRLWPNAKNKAQMAVLQQNDTPIESPLQEFPLAMHTVKNVTGALSSSLEADKWLLSFANAKTGDSQLLYRNYWHPQRLAQLQKQTSKTKSADMRSIDLQVTWQANQISLQMIWQDL